MSCKHQDERIEKIHLNSVIPVKKENGEGKNKQKEQKKCSAAAIPLDGLREFLVTLLHILCSFDCLRTTETVDAQNSDLHRTVLVNLSTRCTFILEKIEHID